MPANNYVLNEQKNCPWGRWRILGVGAGFAVKKITVNPGQRLSLQLHQNRQEHWTIVLGEALVTIENKQVTKKKGEFILIPAKTLHRVLNTGAEPLVFIEVQTGSLLDEADIERVEDDYGRTKNNLR